MAFTEQEKEAALKLYDELGSVGQVINKLGYPSRQNMYTWIKNRDIEKKRNKYDCSDEPDHRRHPSLDSKLEIFRCKIKVTNLCNQKSPELVTFSMSKSRR